MSVLTMHLLSAGAEGARKPHSISLSPTDEGYSLTFVVPEVNISTIKADNQEFSTLDIKEFGRNSDVGFPSLPHISFNIIIPDTATTPKVKIDKSNSRSLKLDKKLYPVQQPWPKSRPLSERPFSMNRAYYGSAGKKDPRIEVSKPFIVGGIPGVTITVRPFWYNPASNTLSVAETLTVSIILPGKSKISGLASSTSTGSATEDIFVNSDELGTSLLPKANENYLIISSPAFAASCSRLITYRQNRGYTVALFTTDVTGTTTTAIKAFIQNRYNSIDTRPSFILLVGDVGDIPAWSTTTADNPWTDLYYGTLDGTDYFPDAAVGRFSATTVAELTNMVNKTVIMDSSIDNITKNAVFLASQDNYSVSEGTHNYVITNAMQTHDYTSTKRYSYTTSATTAQVLNDLALGQVFCVYSGHGSETSWADGPPVSQSQVRALTNTIKPFVYSFSCLTGSYRNTAECFGESWVRGANGASSYWGSSVTSYWGEDDILEKRIFDAIFSNDITRNCPSFNSGKMGLYNYYGNTSMIQRYFEMYNLMGDPALALYNNWSPGVAVQYQSSAIAISTGNGDAFINPDERIAVTATLTNRGVVDAANVTATLSTTDPYVTINHNTSLFGAIAARGGSASAQDPFDLSILQSCPTPRTIPFTLTMTDLQGNITTANVTIEVYTSSLVRGHVYGVPDNTPVSGAKVFWNGPLNDSTTTDALGAYSFLTIDGSYLVQARSNDYFPSLTQTVSTPPVVENVDFYLGRPEVTATPNAFNVTVPVGNATDRTLIITNSGSEPLSYTFSIEENSAKSTPAESLYTADHFTPLPKGAPDLPNSKLAVKGHGGPDTFGYRWVDSDEAGGPAYQWENISTSGTRLSLSGDDNNTGVNLSFPFPFYGNEYSSLYVCSNGFISFGTAATTYSNQPLPSSSTPNNIVAPYWDDLYIGTGSSVYFKDFSDRAIIQFDALTPYSGTGVFTFQIVINANGKIIFYYNTMAGTVTSATVGIENRTGTDGLQVAYNTSYIHNNLAISFKNAPDWLSVTPEAGSVNALQSQNVEVHFSAQDLVAGNYLATLSLSHDAPLENNPVHIPVAMTVTEGAVLQLLPAITGVSSVAVDRAGTLILENSVVGSTASGKASGSRFQLFLK